MFNAIKRYGPYVYVLLCTYVLIGTLATNEVVLEKLEALEAIEAQQENLRDELAEQVYAYDQIIAAKR